MEVRVGVIVVVRDAIRLECMAWLLTLIRVQSILKRVLSLSVAEKAGEDEVDAVQTQSFAAIQTRPMRGPKEPKALETPFGGC